MYNEVVQRKQINTLIADTINKANQQSINEHIGYETNITNQFLINDIMINVFENINILSKRQQNNINIIYNKLWN